MKTKSRIVSAMAVAAAVAGVGFYAAPAANAVVTITNNNDGTFTVTGTAGAASEVVWVCPTTILAANCDGTLSSWEYNYSSAIVTKTFSSGTIITQNGHGGPANTNAQLADGTYNVGIGGASGARIATLSNVTIGTGGGGGGGGGSTSSASAPTETLSLALSASGATCTVPNPSGVSGSWLTLPSADQCTQSGPTAKAGAVLLGWSTSASFPIARAQAQVDKKWGAIDETIDGTRMIFIPAGMATFVSGSNNLFPIWSK